MIEDEILEDFKKYGYLSISYLRKKYKLTYNQAREIAERILPAHTQEQKPLDYNQQQAWKEKKNHDMQRFLSRIRERQKP